MDEHPPQPSQVSPEIPVSVFHSPIDQLLRSGALTGAGRPGVLGSTGRFEVVRIIGTGGMGVVVLAQDPQRMEKVVIKFLRPDLSSSATLVSRFRAEAHHMQRLGHVGIVPVLEILESGSTPCFVMPFMEQGSLAHALQAGKPLSAELVLRVGLSIAEALAHAHAKGIIHRDLKPANVLLCRDGTACLSDFGLARSFSSNDPSLDVDKDHCEGTAPYMSPAVASGEAEDTRCDVYGFGALLYEMLTGKPPYHGADTHEILEKIKAGPPVPILQVNPKADAALTTVAEGAMARELRHRYAQMADVVRDLKRAEAGLAPMGPRGYHRAIALRDALTRVPKAVRWLAAAGFVFSVAGAAFWHYGGHHLEVISTFSLPQIASWGEAKVVQWDGVGAREFAVPRERDFVVVGSQGQLIGSFGLLPPVATTPKLSLVKDVNGDGMEEVFVGWADDTNAYLAAINQTGFPLRRWSVKRTEFTRGQWGRDVTTLWGKRLLDLDGDGRLEILVFVISNHSQPRGLYCFDTERGVLKWAHTLAGFPSSIEVVDLNGDGEQEIVVGTHAPSNKDAPPVDGTDNYHSYLLALSSRGELLWRREIADYFTSVHPVIIRSDRGHSQLYAWINAASDLRRENQHPHPDVGLILALSGTGEELARYDAGGNLHSCVGLAASEIGRHRILATDQAGRLHELTAELDSVSIQELVPKRFNAVFLRIVGVLGPAACSPHYTVLESAEYQRFGQPVAGATPEEFEKIQWHNRCLIVLDESLSEVARFTEPGPWSTASWQITTADLDSDGVAEIIWMDERLRVLKLQRGR